MKSKLLLLVGAVVFLGIISLVFLPKPKEQQSVYYITSLSDEELFAYFKKILTGRSCTVSDVIKNNVIKTQSYITFIYSGAEGLIAPDPFHSAYSVLYPLR